MSNIHNVVLAEPFTILKDEPKILSEGVENPGPERVQKIHDLAPSLKMFI